MEDEEEQQEDQQQAEEEVESDAASEQEEGADGPEQHRKVACKVLLRQLVIIAVDLMQAVFTEQLVLTLPQVSGFFWRIFLL